MVNGAAGAVGSSAVQLAVARGARVIGTARPSPTTNICARSEHRPQPTATGSPGACASSRPAASTSPWTRSVAGRCPSWSSSRATRSGRHDRRLPGRAGDRCQVQRRAGDRPRAVCAQGDRRADRGGRVSRCRSRRRSRWSGSARPTSSARPATFAASSCWSSTEPAVESTAPRAGTTWECAQTHQLRPISPPRRCNLAYPSPALPEKGGDGTRSRAWRKPGSAPTVVPVRQLYGVSTSLPRRAAAPQALEGLAVALERHHVRDPHRELAAAARPDQILGGRRIGLDLHGLGPDLASALAAPRSEPRSRTARRRERTPGHRRRARPCRCTHRPRPPTAREPRPQADSRCRRRPRPRARGLRRRLSRARRRSTRAPRLRASCSANPPTMPAAPVISTRSSSFATAASTKSFAVSADTGIALPASNRERVRQRRQDRRREQRSARPARRRPSTAARRTRALGGRRQSRPRSPTRPPAGSSPEPPIAVNAPPAADRSHGPSEAARTLTSSSPSPGVGSGISVSSSPSTPLNDVITIARTRRSLSHDRRRIAGCAAAGRDLVRLGFEPHGATAARTTIGTDARRR